MKRPKPSAPQSKAYVPQPPKLLVEENPLDLTITRRWNRRLGYQWLFFGTFFGLCVYFGVADSLVDPSIGNLLIALFLFSMAGAMLYCALAQLFNQTTVRVSYDELSVRHGPLPWPGKFEIFRGDVKQLFVRKHQYQERDKSLTYTYSLHLIDIKQKYHRLVEGLPNPQEARFLEDKIERYLQLKDEKIDGEFMG
jgi:hypothetical protein